MPEETSKDRKAPRPRGKGDAPGRVAQVAGILPGDLKPHLERLEKLYTAIKHIEECLERLHAGEVFIPTLTLVYERSNAKPELPEEIETPFGTIPRNIFFGFVGKGDRLSSVQLPLEGDDFIAIAPAIRTALIRQYNITLNKFT